jgi:hypothetical protein
MSWTRHMTVANWPQRWPREPGSRLARRELADAARRDYALSPPSVHVERNAAGEVIQAIVTSGDMSIVWFAAEDLCLKAKAKLEGSGAIVSPKELR